jgi:two-component sensor histidine kinase
MILVPLLNPKFANVPAEKSCELRVRGTSEEEGALAGTLATELPSAASWVFLAELSHRINNEYATAISMVSVAAARAASEEARTALEDVGARLHDFARAHHALEMPLDSALIDAAGRIREVCQSISQSKLKTSGIKLTLVEHPLEMESDRCWRLCLILSELITNAARHALGTAGGAIQVEVRPLKSAIECRVSDNGCAPKRVRPGRGIKIVEALASSLDGSIEWAFGPYGSTVVVTFSADQAM